LLSLSFAKYFSHPTVVRPFLLAPAGKGKQAKKDEKNAPPAQYALSAGEEPWLGF
jgi:hypothetical protein